MDIHRARAEDALRARDLAVKKFVADRRRIAMLRGPIGRQTLVKRIFLSWSFGKRISRQGEIAARRLERRRDQTVATWPLKANAECAAKSKNCSINCSPSFVLGITVFVAAEDAREIKQLRTPRSLAGCPGSPPFTMPVSPSARCATASKKLSWPGNWLTAVLLLSLGCLLAHAIMFDRI